MTNYIIKNFSILGTGSLLFLFSIIVQAKPLQAIEAAEAASEFSYENLKNSKEWISAIDEANIYRIKNVFVKFNDAKVYPNKDGDEIIEIWQKIIITYDLPRIDLYAGDYHLERVKYDCTNPNYEILSNALYSKNDVLKATFKPSYGTLESEYEIKNPNISYAYSAACIYRNTYLRNVK